jgi:hypothetical protein
MLVNATAKVEDLLLMVSVCGGLERVTMTWPKLIGALGLNPIFGFFAAYADPAVADSMNSNENARPPMDRVDDLNSIFQIPP